jgi:DNA-binding CsgD family transcriptional regulator
MDTQFLTHKLGLKAVFCTLLLISGVNASAQLTLGGLLEQYRKSTNWQDSVWGVSAVNLLRNAPVEDAVEHGFNLCLLLETRRNPAAAKFAAEWEATMKKQTSCLPNAYLKLWEAEKLFKTNNSDNYPVELHAVLKNFDCLDSSRHLEIYLSLGVFHFFRQNSDSAGFYFRNAARMALAHGDSAQVFRSHINLGTFMNGQGYPQTAMGYFRTADQYRMAVDYGTRVLLWNNMASLLRREGTWELAASVLARISPDKYISPVTQLLIGCNLYDICFVGDVKIENACDTVVSFLERNKGVYDYYRPLAEARLYDNKMRTIGEESANSYFKTVFPELIKDTALFWSAFGEFFLDWQQKGAKIPLSASQLETLSPTSALFDSDKDRAYFYSVLARAWLEEKNYERSAKAWELHDRYLTESIRYTDLKNIEDFQAAYRNDSLRQALLLNAERTELLAQNAKVYSYFMWLFFFLVLVLLAWAISYYKYAHRRLRLIEKEKLVNKQQENVYLEKINQIYRERSIQAFLRNFQDVLIEKLGIWAKRLRKGQFSENDLSEFHDMSHEMRALLQAIQKFKQEDTSEASDELFEGSIPELICDPPLNLLEQKLLILTYQGLTTKEISAILGKSDRYINNVRSRIRQKLNIPSSQTLEAFMDAVIKGRKTN